jgi:predicted NBD/HSP70 family sugar kinase
VKKRTILVVDIGGTHVKLMVSARERRKFDSGPTMTPSQWLRRMKQTLTGWEFDAVSIGFPAPVRNGRIMHDPKHLGKGWARYDFRKALK